MDPDGKTAIVTGAAGGLGALLVERLQAAGAHVCALDRDAAGLHELQARVPGAVPVACDVTDTTAIDRALEECISALGVPHLLINNAGIIHSEPLIRVGAEGIEAHDPATWNRVLTVNLSSVFYVTSRVVQKMAAARIKGLVVNISSVTASGNPGQSAYSAAKAGLDALTATWARELGPFGIRVAGVAPGYTDTPSTRAAVSDAILKEIVRKTPARRLGRPEEIVDGILAVIHNDFFNGKTLALDGGLTL